MKPDIQDVLGTVGLDGLVGGEWNASRSSARLEEVCRGTERLLTHAH